jgi:hypothetical protein
VAISAMLLISLVLFLRQRFEVDAAGFQVQRLDGPARPDFFQADQAAYIVFARALCIRVASAAQQDVLGFIPAKAQRPLKECLSHGGVPAVEI